MSDPAHTVSFTAEDEWLVARCSCGWLHRWKPDHFTIQEWDYGYILAFGLRHSRTGDEDIPVEDAF